MSSTDISPSDWDAQVLGASGVVLVDMWAPWCIPCKRLEPILHQVCEELSVRCVRLNADDAPQIVADHTVLSLPTVLVFRDGAEIDRIVGVPKKKRLHEQISLHLD